MNWSALGAVSELAAALAFLASFVFIRQQMAQNHKVTKVSHQREILNASRDFFAADVTSKVGRCRLERLCAKPVSRYVHFLAILHVRPAHVQPRATLVRPPCDPPGGARSRRSPGYDKEGCFKETPLLIWGHLGG